MNLLPEHLKSNLPLGNGVKIVAVHPSGLVALEKPMGVLSHPNRPSERGRSLLKASFDFDKECFYDLGEQCDYKDIFLLHRLDSATSGIILIALNQKMADGVKAQFEGQRVEKTYLAIVRGRPQGIPGVWIDRFEKRHLSRGQVRVQTGGVQLAKTRVQLIKMDNNKMGLSLVRLVPYTGRTHQLRVQCAKRGVPIIGDATYGDFQVNRQVAKATKHKRLFLHAQRLALNFRLEGKAIRFSVETPVPEAFESLLAFDREPLSFAAPKTGARSIAKKQAIHRNSENSNRSPAHSSHKRKRPRH